MALERRPETRVEALILIRHAAPERCQGVPPREWSLSGEGRRGAAALGGRLAVLAPDALFCSHERKAIETAEIAGRALGLAPRVRDGLEEHHRESVPLMDEHGFCRAVERVLREPDRPGLGEETAAQARDRFGAALNALLADSGARRPAVVSHGTVLSLHAARATGADPVALWRRLGLPACVVLCYPGPRLGEVIEEV